MLFSFWLSPFFFLGNDFYSTLCFSTTIMAQIATVCQHQISYSNLNRRLYLYGWFIMPSPSRKARHLSHRARLSFSAPQHKARHPLKSESFSFSPSVFLLRKNPPPPAGGGFFLSLLHQEEAFSSRAFTFSAFNNPSVAYRQLPLHKGAFGRILMKISPFVL